MKNPFLSIVAGLLLSAQAQAMVLTSTSIANGTTLGATQVHAQCGGGNQSPTLSWSDAPPETKSFAVTVFDADAQGGWWHWIVFNIPTAVHALPADAGGEGELPAGSVQGENDFGVNLYGGACPPPGSGVHHYEFTLWALDTPTAPFDAKATGATIGPFLKAHALATAKIVAVYQR